MRILIATGIYPPDIGGPAIYSKLLTEEFSKQGIIVDVITYGTLKNKFWALRHFIFFLRIFKKASKFDILYAQDVLNSGISAWISARVFHRKFVLKVVGDYAWEQGVQRFNVQDLLDDFLFKGHGLIVSIFKFLRSFVAKRADSVIVPSRYLAGVVAKWGVSPERISVIYNSVKKPEVSISRAEARKKLGAGDEGTILFSAGRDVPWKGFKMLREIIPEVQKKFPNTRLVAGSFPKKEYELWIQASDIFLQNTGYEGFSHQILEAMSCGLPIITTNAGGNKEIVENEKNALVVEYNDKKAWTEAIERLIRDKTLQQKLSAGAKATAQKFLNKDMIGETLKVLEKV